LKARGRNVTEADVPDLAEKCFPRIRRLTPNADLAFLPLGVANIGNSVII
jgi:hypothetical protein